VNISVSFTYVPSCVGLEINPASYTLFSDCNVTGAVSEHGPLHSA